MFSLLTFDLRMTLKPDNNEGHRFPCFYCGQTVADRHIVSVGLIGSHTRGRGVQCDHGPLVTLKPGIQGRRNISELHCDQKVTDMAIVTMND